MKIGICALGLGAYWPQFTGMLNDVLQHHNVMLDKFSDYPLTQAGMVDSQEKAKAAGQLFRQDGVNIVFVHLTTYVSSENLLPLVRDLNVPIILLNVQSVKALDLDNIKTIGAWLGQGATCAGLPEMTAGLLRYEKTFDVISGYLRGDAAVDEAIQQWCDATAAVSALQAGNVGVMGRTYPGMMDLNVDETHILKKTGTYVWHANWEDIVSELQQPISEEQIQQASGDIQQSFIIDEGVDKESLRYASKALVATERLVKRKNLIALPNHFEVEPSGEVGRILGVSNLIFSILMRKGIACPVEADIKAAIGLFLLKQVGGSATLAEFYSMDFNDGSCLIGHSGAADPCISSQKPKLIYTPVFHGKPGAGFLTQFSPDPGPVTMMAFAQDAQGSYRFIIAEGEVIAGKTLQLGDTNARIRFGSDLRGFINRWCATGPTHHCMISLGHHISKMEKVAKLLHLPIEIIK